MTEKQKEKIMELYNSDIFIINDKEYHIDDLTDDIVRKLLTAAQNNKIVCSIWEKQAQLRKIMENANAQKNKPLKSEDYYRWFIMAGYEPEYIEKFINEENYKLFYEMYGETGYIGFENDEASATDEQRTILKWYSENIPDNDHYKTFFQQNMDDFISLASRYEAGELIDEFWEIYKIIWPLDLIYNGPVFEIPSTIYINK